MVSSDKKNVRVTMTFDFTYDYQDKLTINQRAVQHLREFMAGATDQQIIREHLNVQEVVTSTPSRKPGAPDKDYNPYEVQDARAGGM